MAYIYNGTERAMSITVNKKLGSVQQNGYPVTYWIYNYINQSYLANTEQAIQELDAADYAARMLAFIDYIEITEAGFEYDNASVDNADTQANLAGCPVASTTTTLNVTSTLYIARVSNSVDDICTAETMNVYSAWYSWEVGTRLFIDENLTIELSGYSFINIDGYGEVWEINPSGLDSGMITALSVSECL